MSFGGQTPTIIVLKEGLLPHRRNDRYSRCSKVGLTA